jgi:DNA invertase Pin-like site-specific DNA recombinase
MKAAIYCRIATKNSDSIELQEAILRNFAKENNIDVDKVYTDNGVSGLTLDRPAFCAMMTDIENGKVDCILAKDVARICRDFLCFGTWLNKMRGKGVRVICVNDEFDSTATSDKVRAKLRGALLQQYKEMQSAKIRASIANKR